MVMMNGFLREPGVHVYIWLSLYIGTDMQALK